MLKMLLISVFFLFTTSSCIAEELLGIDPSEVKGLAVGQSVKLDLMLKNSEGQPISLGEILNKQATLVLFFRGGW